MSELIRKQDAVDAAIKADMENHNGILSEKRARVLEEHIAILPPVQPNHNAEPGKMEIVHCKDCKYSIDEYNDGDCYCKRPSRELVWIGASWDFFCKAGAKREGE